MRADAKAPTTKYAVIKISAIVMLTPVCVCISCMNESEEGKKHSLIYANMIPVIMKNRLNNDVRLPNRFANAYQINVYREI